MPPFGLVEISAITGLSLGYGQNADVYGVKLAL